MALFIYIFFIEFKLMCNERKQIWKSWVERGTDCKGHKETSRREESAFMLIVLMVSWAYIIVKTQIVHFDCIFV